MPQHHPRQSEQDGRTVREVTEHERVGDAAVLVHDDEVRHLVRAARVGQFGHDVVTAVDAGRIGNAEAQFLCLFCAAVVGFVVRRGGGRKWRTGEGTTSAFPRRPTGSHTHAQHEQGCANGNAPLQTVAISKRGLARW
mgnify:FL=1